MKKGILDNIVVEQIVLKRFAMMYKEQGPQVQERTSWLSNVFQFKRSGKKMFYLKLQKRRAICESALERLMLY